MVNDFGLTIEKAPVEISNGDDQGDKQIVPTASTINEQPQLTPEVDTNQLQVESTNSSFETPKEDEVILDYRSKFFEELEKNKELQSKIDELNKKIENIKEILG